MMGRQDWPRGRRYDRRGRGGMMGGCQMNPMMMGGMGMMPMMAGDCCMNPMMMGGRGMMGGGMGMMGYNPEQAEKYLQNYDKYQKFFTETRELRKKLYDMRFDYSEARWNPNTTVKELHDMQVKMNQLREDIYKKRPQGLCPPGKSPKRR